MQTRCSQCSLQRRPRQGTCSSVPAQAFCASMVCSWCGSRKHNKRTCPFPGAKRTLQLEQEVRALKKQTALQPQKGRRQLRFGRQTWGVRKRKAQTDYSGPTKRAQTRLRDQQRRAKTLSVPANADLQLQAVEQLQELGFLPPKPTKCPACRGRTLQKASVVRETVVACLLLRSNSFLFDNPLNYQP